MDYKAQLNEIESTKASEFADWLSQQGFKVHHCIVYIMRYYIDDFNSLDRVLNLKLKLAYNLNSKDK